MKKKDPIDALTKMLKQRPAATPVHKAEPAHSIISRLGGVRELSRQLGVSAAAVTRWQTKKTKDDKRGADGVIPEARRDAIIAVAKLRRVRLSKSDFIKA